MRRATAPARQPGWVPSPLRKPPSTPSVLHGLLRADSSCSARLGLARASLTLALVPLLYLRHTVHLYTAPQVRGSLPLTVSDPIDSLALSLSLSLGHLSLCASCGRASLFLSLCVGVLLLVHASMPRGWLLFSFVLTATGTRLKGAFAPRQRESDCSFSLSFSLLLFSLRGHRVLGSCRCET